MAIKWDDMKAKSTCGLAQLLLYVYCIETLHVVLFLVAGVNSLCGSCTLVPQSKLQYCSQNQSLSRRRFDGERRWHSGSSGGAPPSTLTR